MQLSSRANNLHQILNPKQFASYVKTYWKKNIINLSSTEFAHSVPNLIPDKQF